MDDEQILTTVIAEEYSGHRLDSVLARIFPDYSRSCLQGCIARGQVRVNGRVLRPRDPVSGGEQVVFAPPAGKVVEAKPEPLPLAIVYEDEDLLVVNKAPGMVVHPAPGNRTGTLLNAVLHHCAATAELPRGGIVHRLDKDTSGLMVVAKTHRAYTGIVEQLQARRLERRYFAVVWGVVTTGGRIDAPIGRNPRDRKRMAVVNGGRSALTHYRIAARLGAHTALDVALASGRTHQIRVHLSHIGHPVVGDPLYGGHFRAIAGWPQEALDRLKKFKRQALHARRLSLLHPRKGVACSWEVALPCDIRGLLNLLREQGKGGG